jgi:uncharacterized protein
VPNVLAERIDYSAAPQPQLLQDTNRTLYLAKITAMITPELLEILACPVCRKPLVLRGEEALKCNECRRVYPIRNGIPILLEPEATVEEF